MVYVILDDDFEKVFKLKGGEQVLYVRKMELMGVLYNLYVYSYLNYGLLAARVEVLKLVDEFKMCFCFGKGFEGLYMYGGKQYKVIVSLDGGDYDKCK